MVSLLQPSAFMIVLGGTFCAAVVNFKPSTLMTALRSSVDVFLERQPSQIKVIDEIIYLAHQAKMKGLFYLNNLVDDIQDPFLKRGVQLSIDFNNPQMIYDILKAEISYDEEEELINSRVFEALGGYAPTFGIVGAVFGLIQIMGYIQQPDILAQGIAVAFVSTLYGVGFANLLFLPVAGKLKMNTRERILLKEVVLQGIVSIQMEESPMVIEEKLVAYLKYHNKTHSIENKKQTGLYGLR
ncbi:MAG TPA: MotA/TolQ/ExbB proton channel family protein [Candidatus Limenecus avicola]|uniref:MotA/TolQ/ExbB proton channel family protein n=1 Tax=Candidatus Limenecus avicola TaxID=2840847 RepID=A0A9D1MYJ2_9CLOT|nr:MotA/TolQ/ExbB proton channel family protein [Candidatus Limenecus avicola]